MMETFISEPNKGKIYIEPIEALNNVFIHQNYHDGYGYSISHLKTGGCVVFRVLGLERATKMAKELDRILPSFNSNVLNLMSKKTSISKKINDIFNKFKGADNG